MLVSDIIIVMTKRKKEIWHEHVEDNPQILKRGGGGVMFVTIIHFIILNNLFGRESYWYCLGQIHNMGRNFDAVAFTHGNRVKL